MVKCTFSEFAASSCKWSKVASLQRKSCKFGPQTWVLMLHAYVLFIIRYLVHHKNKCWKDISHRTLRSNSAAKGWNEISLDKLIFRLPFLFPLINQKSSDEKNINIWHQEPHFIPNQRTNFTGFNTADSWLCPIYKMKSWPPKRPIY